MYSAEAIIIATPAVIIVISIWAIALYYIARELNERTMYNALCDNTAARVRLVPDLVPMCCVEKEVETNIDGMFDFSDVDADLVIINTNKTAHTELNKEIKSWIKAFEAHRAITAAY